LHEAVGDFDSHGLELSYAHWIGTMLLNHTRIVRRSQEGFLATEWVQFGALVLLRKPFDLSLQTISIPRG
jgi:hypothetical protein